MPRLDGEQLRFRTAADRRALVGKAVKYLRLCDIDRSGRGYFFPRFAEIISAHGRNLELDNGEYLHSGDIVEMVAMGDGE